ncbi:uncharacterized protein LOC131216756 [Anopheles bellator]|uniref:uncharacterized protein LOC131216756 n=1 Tax=Anopheles bellator TaxID=139047 RepID=UPI002648DD54|nr:uncharacterized protein LOC131216756 [Anopheles bellator]
MQTQEFDTLAKEIIGQQDHINRYLGKAARVCTKLRSPTEDDDLPGTLLALAKEEQNWPQQFPSSDSVDRPREEDIDNFFSAIRARPTTVRSQRQGSLKKSAASLHQSRVLTEHNPAVVANTSTSSSCSNVSTVGSKSMSAKHSSPVDLEALVVRFRQAISTLEQIDNAPFEEIDLTEVHHFYRQEWSTVVKSFEQVDNLLIQFQQQVEAERRRDRSYQPIIKKELIESMERVQSTLHDVCYVKSVENLPDLKTTVSEEAFALSECLDVIDETIRQKHL